jgi:hypothetical protein
VQLNLPIFDQLTSCQNLLIAGMGGGFDIFCGLPIYFALRERGQMVHLANFSFSDIVGFEGGLRLTDTLVGVNAEFVEYTTYFPELYLSRWFKEKRGEAVTIWSFENTGVRPLLENYQTLVEHLAIDGILLIDGGVDSLLRGDEAEIATLLEDSVSLLAVNELKSVTLKLIACLGFGAERDMNYAQIFENMAKINELGGFLGSCSLTRQMEVYQTYEEAVIYAHEQPFQDPSVINASVVSAVRGHFGNHHLTEKTRGSRLWISPLMPIYWFFDLPIVARRNMLYSALRWTDTLMQAYKGLLQARRGFSTRKPTKIPLP